MAVEAARVFGRAAPQLTSRDPFTWAPRCVTSLAVALAIAACSPGRHPRVEIVRDGQPNRSNYNFLFEHWTEPSLANLARSEQLLEVVADLERPFEIALLLQSWTSREMRFGFPDPYPKSNATDILTAIRTGTTAGFCAQYSYVLADALKALGFYAVRYVESESRGGTSHFTVEMWSDEFQKWVLLDPLYNIYYSDTADVPMSALELHDLAVIQQYESARVVQLDPRPTEPRLEELAHLGVELYYHLAVSTRSDYMRHPRPVTTAERVSSFIYFDDPRVDPADRLPHYLLRSELRDDLAFPMHQVYLQVLRSGAEEGVMLGFSTGRTVPNFRNFEVKIDDGSWQEVVGRRYTLPVRRGRTVVLVRTRNQFGHAGLPSEVWITF